MSSATRLTLSAEQIRHLALALITEPHSVANMDDMARHNQDENWHYDLLAGVVRLIAMERPHLIVHQGLVDVLSDRRPGQDVFRGAALLDFATLIASCCGGHPEVAETEHDITHVDIVADADLPDPSNLLSSSVWQSASERQGLYLQPECEASP